MKNAYATWWLEYMLAMLGPTPIERQAKAEAFRRQFRVIEGGKRT